MKNWFVFVFLLVSLYGCFEIPEYKPETLMDHTPAFSTENFTPQMIASPQAFFSASQPAKFVFDNGANFCGVTKDLETRCWPQNWLDTGYTWRFFNLEKILLLWDSTRVVALDHETFEVLFEAPNTGAAIWNGFPGVFNMLVNANVYDGVLVGSENLLLSSSYGVYNASSDGSVDSLTNGTIYMGSVRFSGFWKNSEGADCLFGYPDSLICITGNSVQSVPMTVGIGGSIAPILWNGSYWWIGCDDAHWCHVKKSESDVLPSKTYTMADMGGGLYSYIVASLASDNELVFANMDSRSEYYTNLYVSVSQTPQHIDTTWSWGVEKPFDVAMWYNSKGNIVVALSDMALVGSVNPIRVTKSVKIYKLRSDGTLVK